MMELSTGGTGLLLEMLQWLWLAILLGSAVALLITPDWRRGLAWHTKFLASFTVFAVLGELAWRWNDPAAAVPLAGWASSFLVLSLTLATLTPRSRRDALEKLAIEVTAPSEVANDHEQEAETLRVLVGSVAHEFNNLLTGILGNASLISLKPDIGEEIGEIETAGRRAAELSRLLQAYSGKTHAVMDSLVLSDLVKSSLDAMRSIVGRCTLIHVESDISLPPISADPVQIRLLLRNLVENAAEASAANLAADEAREIIVQTGIVELDRQQLDNLHMGSRRMPGSYVFLEVVDSGPGLDEETRARMFEPFFTTWEKRRGLGLPTAQSIVRAHQGVIEVHGKPGQGTRLRALFPTGRPKPASRKGVPRKAPTKESIDSRTEVPSEARGTVLVVDDERIILDLATNVLELHGYEVLTADAGEPALTLYRRHGRDIRAVLLDLSMPIMGGEKVFDEVRRINPRARIVLMTGHDAEDVSKNFDHRGLAAVLQKPFKPEDLVETLRSVLNR